MTSTSARATSPPGPPRCVASAGPTSRLSGRGSNPNENPSPNPSPNPNPNPTPNPNPNPNPSQAQWARLRDACDPVTSAAGATPPMVLRSDAWVALPVLRCLGGILQAATLGSGGCNPMWRRLQPHVAEAATPCSRAARAALPRRHPAGGASDS